MAITTPPFRTSLLTANGVPFGTDNGDVQTTRDWWMYWNQLTDRSNSNSKLATAGTHGDRPMPESMPEGALYYENDRGVLYANTLGVWQYVAGTMWGTLVPDQRPTDLGTHDAGFDFRTTVAPPREFIWSQTAWVDVTPESNQVQFVLASGSLTLTTSAQDVPGAALTLTKSGRYWMQAVFDFWLQGTADIGFTFIGFLNAGGSALTQFAIFTPQFVSGPSGNRATVGQQWYESSLPAGMVLKLQAQKSGGTGASTAGATHTSLSAMWIGP